MTTPLMTAAVAHIAAADANFATFLETAPPCELDTPFHESDFETLVFAVVGQQISAKAADSITLRVLKHTGRPLTAEKVLEVGFDGLRECGFTRAKARTVTEVAQAVITGDLDFSMLSKMSDDEAISYLTRFWGIGHWTSHMLMIFRLSRLDIWPTGDLGVRKGWAIIHHQSSVPTAQEMEHVADQLSPYRSVAAWYCWVATRENSLFW